MLKLVLAAFVPFLLVLFFTRVTYNHYVGTLLTAALLIASYYAGHMDTIYVAILDVVSLIAGFIVANKMKENVKKST
ncbi:CsbA family protein [Bacillus alveayuensis]|jgi:general stress protein CsbA|uniref:CsbA family protein n=1 Tax=Aeribacillus alveayuensis TaxID=279215 RepID=UPI0005CD766F|nr:CsbA family protein [Bacillus alveayuensis]